jgi:hypothetical protein
MIGCAGGEGSGRSERQTATVEAFLAEQERSFQPTRYEIPQSEIRRQEKLRAASSDTSAAEVSFLPDTIPGFRVQILMTEDIDRATGFRDSLMAQLPEEWVYIVYDAPNYKVRVGNFSDRPSGNRMAEQLGRMGYLDAWIVPDLIVRNAAPRSPVSSQESIPPEENPENNR